MIWARKGCSVETRALPMRHNSRVRVRQKRCRFLRRTSAEAFPLPLSIISKLNSPSSNYTSAVFTVLLTRQVVTTLRHAPTARAKRPRSRRNAVHSSSEGMPVEVSLAERPIHRVRCAATAARSWRSAGRGIARRKPPGFACQGCGKPPVRRLPDGSLRSPPRGRGIHE